MASPSPSTPAEDTDFVAFINEFLFNPSPQSSARSILRHQRTPPRRKRYRMMWRAAATSLMKKRYSSQENHAAFSDDLPKELPSQVYIDNGNSSKETHLSVSDHLHRELPFQASSDNGCSSQTTLLPSAQQIHRDLLSQSSHNNADKHSVNLPSEVSVTHGNTSQATHFSSADQILRNSPSQISFDGEHSSQAIDSLSTDQPLGYLPSQCSLGFGGGLTTIDSQQHNHNRFDIDITKEDPLITPGCSNTTMKGSPLSCYSKVQPFEATGASVAPKRSSGKPPRPPRPSVPRSGSYRAKRLKNAARRVKVDNVRRKQKLLKSSSNATSMWALIITLCFVSIMLVQGFLGSNSKDLDSKAEGQLVGEGVSSLSSYLGVPPFSSEGSTHTFVEQHGASSRLDQLEQKKQRDLPFMNLRRHRMRRLGATPSLLR